MASIKRLTKQQEDTPKPPNKDRKRGYWWLFGEDAPANAEEKHHREVRKKREEEIRKRREGYEWFFE